MTLDHVGVFFYRGGEVWHVLNISRNERVDERGRGREKSLTRGGKKERRIGLLHSGRRLNFWLRGENNGKGWSAHLSKHGDCMASGTREIKIRSLPPETAALGIFSPTSTIVLYIRVWSLTLGSPCHRTVDKINGDVRKWPFFFLFFFPFFLFFLFTRRPRFVTFYILRRDSRVNRK